MKIKEIAGDDAVADHGNSMEVVYCVVLSQKNPQISALTLFAFY